MTALQEVFARFTTEMDDRPLQQGQASVAGLTERLQQLGKVVAGSAVVLGIRGFIDESARIGDELDKTSRVIGINSEALQAWRHAANLSGVGAEAFNTSMIRLQRTMYDAQRGTATALEPFQRLGVSFEDAEGQLRPVDEVLRDMADPLNALESSSERVAILNTIMGRSGARIGPLFDQGREGVEAMQAELARLGGGASQDFIQAAAELTDANARLDMAFLSLRSQIGVVLLPVIQRAIEAFTDLAAGFKAAAENTELVRAGLTVMGALAAAVAVKMLIAFGPALLTVMAIAAGVALIVVALDDFYVAIQGGDSVIGRSVTSFEQWIEKTREQAGLLGMIANMLSAIALAAENAGIAIEGLAGTEIEVSPEAQAALDAAGVDVNTASGRRFLRRLQRDGTATPEAVEALREDQALERGASTAALGTVRSIAPTTTAAVEALAPAARQALGSGQAGTLVQNNQVTINGSGLDEAATERVVRRALDRTNREAQRALVSGGGDL